MNKDQLLPVSDCTLTPLILTWIFLHSRSILHLKNKRIIEFVSTNEITVLSDCRDCMNKFSGFSSIQESELTNLFVETNYQSISLDLKF